MYLTPSYQNCQLIQLGFKTYFNHAKIVHVLNGIDDNNQKRGTMQCRAMFSMVLFRYGIGRSPDADGYLCHV